MAPPDGGGRMIIRPYQGEVPVPVRRTQGVECGGGRWGRIIICPRMEEDAMRKHQRQSIRWFAYDYAQAGAYFVTICTHDHVCLFGRVVGEAMELNPAGKAVWECWYAIPRHFPQVALDEFIVMPNHVHGIVVIGDGRARHASPLPARPQGLGRRSVGSIVGAYKSSVCRRVNAIGGTPGAVLWQRNYYEHVIRNERQLSRIRRYIAENPANWMLDYENPQGQCYGQGEKERFFTY